MTEVERLEYVISADNSKAVTAFQETGKAYEQMDSKLSSSSSSQFGANIASGANTAKGAIGTLSGAVDTLGNKLKGISAGQAFSAIESGASKAARTMQGIGIAATAVGVPVGLLAKNSLTAFADLESQTQRNTALLGGSKAEYEEILRLSKELGASTPFDALEIGAGIESLAAAGYSLKEIQSAMPTVAEMAIATGEDLGAMSEILIATLNSYGEGAEMAASYGDKLATVSNQSSASIIDFGESMKYVGAVADSFGVDINELGASIGILADNNLKGSLAGTGLREIITTLANPTAKVKDLFKSFGLSMDELNPKTQNFVDILAKMRDAGVSDEALMGAFGDRAGPAALILTKNVEELRKQYDTLLNDSEGMLKEFSGKMRDTLGFVMDEMGGTIQNILIEIGAGLKPIVQEMGVWLNDNQQTLIDFAKNAVEGLTPFVEKFMDLAKGFMEWFNGLPTDMKSKIAGLTGLGAAMATIGGPLLLLGSLPVAAIGNIAGVLKGLFEIRGTSAIGTDVSTLVTSLEELSGITAIKDVAQYLVPIGPAAAGAAGEVGLLTTALEALGGPLGIAAAVAVTAGLTAYATNFGDFRDNINGILKDVGSAAANIATGDYERAGRDSAQAFGDGFETVTDLVGGVIQGLPAAFNFANPFNNSGRQTASDFFEGFGAGAVEGIAAQKPAVEEAIRLLTTENAAKEEIPNAIRGWFSGFSLHDEGFNLAETLSDGFLSFKFGPIWGPFLKGAIKQSGDQSGDSTAQQTESDRIIQNKYDKLLERGLTQTASEKTAVDEYFANRAAHSGGYGSVQIDSAAVTESVASGAEQGVTAAAGSIADAVKESGTTGFDEFKAEKNKGLSDREKYTDESLHKLYDTNSNLITKYEALAASKAEEAEATKSGTAAKKKLTTIEAALADNAIGLNDTFETAEGTYKKVIENGAYVAQEQGAAAELLRYNQAETEKQSSADKAAQEKLTDAKKGYADQIERAKLDYSQAIRSAKTPDAIESAKNSYQFKIEDIQLKAQQTGVDISDLNTTLDKTGSTVDILNTKYTTFNQDLLQQLRELEQEKAKKISTAAEKGKIADTDSLDKRIKKLQDEISNNEAELKKSTASQRENVDIVKNSIQTQGDANKAVIEFGPAVDIGKESITTFSDSVGKIDLEGQFRQLFSDIDLREILNSGLNYQADMAVGRKASDADRTAVKEGYEDRFMATVASEVPKAADWAKTIGEPIESALAENGTVWAAVTKSYLENVRGVTGIPSALGWTQNDYMKGYLSGDDYAAINAILKNSRPVVDGVYSGNVDVTGSGGYSDSRGKWWGTTFEAIQKADDATKDYSTSLSALSSAQYASDSRAVALTKAYNQAQDATASLDRYLADSSVSASEAADMQSQLSVINSLLAQSGVDATGGLTNLPGALQAVASAVQSSMAAINAAISSASAAVASAQQYLTSVQTASQYKPDTNYKSSMANKYNINVTGNTFGSTTTAGKVVSDILNSSRASGF